MDANKRQHQYGNTRTSYVEGNTVRKLSAVPDIRREERSYETPAPRKREHKRTQPKAMSGMNFASLFVLTIAIIATVYVCVSYLQLQSEVSNMRKSMVTLENDLTALTNENDAAYAMVNEACDLDTIYKIAVEEYGMVYPNNNEVITYQPSDDSYVRQYEDIPKK